MDFNFTLNRPLVLPSYRILPDEALYMTMDQLKDENLRKNEQIPTYLNLSISLDPPIEIPKENKEIFYNGAENNCILNHCAEWTNNLRNHHKYFKKRLIKTFGENLKGHSILLCRYLNSKLAPPNELFDETRLANATYEEQTNHNIKNDPYAIEKVARFVAMIPFKEDMQQFAKMKDMPDLYCTC